MYPFFSLISPPAALKPLHFVASTLYFVWIHAILIASLFFFFKKKNSLTSSTSTPPSSPVVVYSIQRHKIGSFDIHKAKWRAGFVSFNPSLVVSAENCRIFYLEHMHHHRKNDEFNIFAAVQYLRYTFERQKISILETIVHSIFSCLLLCISEVNCFHIPSYPVLFTIHGPRSTYVCVCINVCLHAIVWR